MVTGRSERLWGEDDSVCVCMCVCVVERESLCVLKGARAWRTMQGPFGVVDVGSVEQSTRDNAGIYFFLSSAGGSIAN